MTDLPPADFTLTVHSTSRTLTVRVAGELDYDTSGELLDTVTAHLGHHRAGPREVRLDCGGITWIDSSGLSALLMIRRRTDDAGAVLHLDDRPPALERLLDLTDVLPYFAAGRTDGDTDEPPGEHGRGGGRPVRTGPTRPPAPHAVDATPPPVTGRDAGGAAAPRRRTPGRQEAGHEPVRELVGGKPDALREF